MHRHVLPGLLALLFSFTAVHAATLEIPTPHMVHSGVGMISGWKCRAGSLTVRFNDGPPVPLLHGASRADVRAAGACPHDRVGFVSIMNWGELGDGQHTAVAYDDGVEFDRATFRVVTPGTSFLRGATGTGTATLSTGHQVTLRWSEAAQSFVVTEWTAAEPLVFNPCLSFGPNNWNGVSSRKLVDRLKPAYLLLVGAFGLTETNYPITLRPHNAGPRIEVGPSCVEAEKYYIIQFRLYADDLNEYYVSYVHAFTHELAHALTNFDFSASRQHEWFEETLAEVAADFVLRSFAQNPPYPLPLIVDGNTFNLNLWQSHADGLDRAMTTDLMNNWGLAPGDLVAAWFPTLLPMMEADPTIRELNWAIGKELRPHFQANANLWRACAYLNLWDTAGNRTFQEYLDSWEAVLREAGEETTLIFLLRQILYGE